MSLLSRLICTKFVVSIELKTMKSFLIMAIGLSLVFSEAQAQKKVSNGSFNTVLKMLLKHDVKELTIPEAATRENAVFLDAREKKEYDVSHIRNVFT